MEINKRTGEVNIENKTYHLTKAELNLLAVLDQNKIVTYEELYNGVYGLRVNEISKSERGGLSTIITRIKHKTGLKVKNYSGYGYKLGGTNGKV